MGETVPVVDRFVIERAVGAGGMGAVYRALDRQSGALVALKIAFADDDQHRARAVVEADALASLDHPAIVRLVASGVGPDGRPYLAMEWLDGEDLAARLKRGRLSPAEAAVLGARVAQGLAAAHARGVVHRDLKPSNLFLPGGDIARVKLVDFGIARLGQQRLTRTGVLLGTPGYMAPEQAMGTSEVGPPTDLFALGAVLFECLVGRAAFTGSHSIAVLAKILLDEPPSIDAVSTGVPPALAEIVRRLLVKVPDQRPTAAEVGAALTALLPALADAASVELGDGGPRSGGAGDVSGIALLPLEEEQGLVCVLVARPAEKEPAPAGHAVPITVAAEGLPGNTTLIDDATLGGAPAHDDAATHGDALERLRAVVAPLGGRAARLLDGTLVASWTGTGVPHDLAARAARAALLARDRLPGAALALGSGLVALRGSLHLGAALDRAAAALETGDATTRAVLIDEVTAGLLDARFEIRSSALGFELVARRTLAESGERLLLGRPAPCVGRERDLRVLGDLLHECVAEPIACAAVVTAPPGTGKSRLRHEMLHQVRLRGDVDIWIAEADELSAGSPFGLLGAAVQCAAGVRPGDSHNERRRKLAERVALRVPEADRARVTALLGEVADAHLPAAAHPMLAVARRDPGLMAEQIRRAFLDLLAAETSAQPVLLVLEDLHWGDLPSLRLVGAAIAALHDRPFMVLGLARPEARDRCPELWAARQVQELRLGGLTRRAAAQLVSHALPDADDTLIQRLVERADGNPLYIEELLRAVAAGRGEDLPETIAAMVQARLEALSPEERRVIRAASVFGGVFWQGAVEGVMDGPSADDPAGVGPLLAALVEREVLVRRTESRFPEEPELTFRHALLREGAYTLLTPDGRAAGHFRAAEWLERQALRRERERASSADHPVEVLRSGAWRDPSGETGAARIARHFEIGRAPTRAAAWYVRAAEHALRAGDPSGTVSAAERGLELLAALTEDPAHLEQELALQLTLARALALLHGPAAPQVGPPIARAWELCKQDSPERFAGLFGLYLIHLARGHHWTARTFAEDLLALARDREPRAALAAHQAIGISCFFLGEHRAAREHLEAALALYDRAQHHDLTLLMGMDFEVQSLSYLTMTFWQLGLLDQAAATLQRALELAEQLARPFTLACAASFAAIYHQARRERPAALDHATRTHAIAKEHGFSHYILQSTILCGWARTSPGAIENGLDEIRRAIAARRARGANAAMTHLLTVEAEAQIAAGKAAEALATLEQAAEMMDRHGERFWVPEIYRLKGELLRDRGGPGDVDDAEDCLLRAIDIARCQGALTMELRATTGLARLWRAQGNGEEARQMLERVLARFSGESDLIDLQEARALLQEEPTP